MNYNTHQKIKSLYSDREDVDFRNSGEAMQQTIKLLAHGGLLSAWTYTGTRRNYTNVDGLVVIRPNIKAMVYAVIYVDYADTYCIDLVHVKRDAATVVRCISDVFIDELKTAYEQIYDDYIRAEQDGFFFENARGSKSRTKEREGFLV